MFVPGMQQGLRLPRTQQRLPRRLLPLGMGFGAVLGVIVTWAAFAARPASDGGDVARRLDAPSRSLDALLLIQPTSSGDELVVRAPSEGALLRVVARFPSTFSLHARGQSSPDGSAAAVLWVDGAPGMARLTLVTLATGRRLETTGEFDYLSSLAWARDGSTVAAVKSASRDASGRADATVWLVEAASGTALPAVDFPSVMATHPVGWSLDGQRLFVVTIDASGSVLWAVREGRPQRLGRLSSGRTQDWSLSPDGSRLAFVDVAGAGAGRTFSGGVIRIATGVVTTVSGEGAQLGAVWRPGSDAPDFGGPGGGLGLGDSAGTDTYVVPSAWSQDGSAIVASVYTASKDGGSLELVTTEGRLPLADARGAAFLGWVTQFK